MKILALLIILALLAFTPLLTYAIGWIVVLGSLALAIMAIIAIGAMFT